MESSKLVSILRASAAAAAVLLLSGATANHASAGAAGDRRACITGAGALVAAKSKGAVLVAKGGVGDYTIRFNRRVDRCVKVATIGFCSVLSPRPGEIAVADGAAPETVWVKTYSSTGVSADRDFHLYVDCD